MHPSDFGDQSLIYSPPWPLSCPAQLQALTVLVPAPSFPSGWLRRGLPARGREQNCHPSDIWLVWQPPPASRAPDTQGDYSSTHNCGPASTRAECILQPGTPQTPLCPCSDIVRHQVASHLLYLDPSLPLGCFWPHLLSGWGFGVSRASHWLWDTETSTSG